MKRIPLALVICAFSALMLSASSWAQCPEDPNDRGECDTLNVICLDCTVDTAVAGPYNVRFPLLVTHDQTQAGDSIAGFAVPLAFTHTNPSAYCSVSHYWNTTSMLYMYPDFDRSIFRHMMDGSDTLYANRMAQLEGDFSYRGWDYVFLDLDGTSHFWLSLVPTGSQDQRWWESDRVLLATMTMRVEDTMHVCVDSTFWPPATKLSYSRSDGVLYTPRDNLPYCFWVGAPRMQVISPNGGEAWGVATTQEITWLSENFGKAKANVKIEYSTNSGGNWITVESSVPDTGSYSWLVPDTPSENCRVKVSDAADGEPYDISDADFSIVQPDFTIEAEPDTQEVQASYSVDYDVILTSLYGFASSCTLTVAGLPAGAAASFDPNPVVPTDTSVMSVSTIRETPPGTYNVTITATEQTKGQVEHSTQVVLIVTPPPDFTIEVDPDSQDVQASFSVDYDVILTSLYGFVSPCTLTVTGLPLGALASFDVNPATPTDTSVMSITTLRTTPPGTYSFTVTATELTKAQVQHSVQVTLVVTPPPDFSIEASPDTLQIPQGGEDSYEVILTSLYGFSSTCTLAVSGLPLNVTGQFDPVTLIPTDTSTLTITVPGTAMIGTYTLTITGTELEKAAIEHSTQVVLIITPPPDFTIEVTPDTLQIPQGAGDNYEVLLTSLWGFDSPCTLTVSGLPSDVTGTFDPPTLVPTGTSDLNVVVPDTADTGFFDLSITATEMTGGKQIAHSVDVVLRITPPPDFTIEVQPDTQEVQASFSVDFDVILTSLWGFASPCTLTASGLPLGALASFDPNPATPTETSTMSISTTRDTPPGTYDVSVTATELEKAGIVHSYDVVLIVTPAPDFTIEVEPDTQEVQASFSVDFDVILTSLYGFASPCDLSASGLPLGASASFDPDPATPTDTSVMTVNTSRSTPPGTYVLTVTATELTKAQVQHSTQVVLIVTPPPDFTIEVQPDTQEVQASFSIDFDVILTSLYGFASPCTLIVAGLPSNTTADFNPNPATPTDTSIMTISTTRDAPPGTYTLTVTATELTKAQVQHSTQVTLIITPPPDFTVDVEPESQDVQAGSSVDFDVTLTSFYGFASPCTLTITDLPADASGSFTPNVVTPTGTSNLHISTAASTPPGAYTVTVTASEMDKGLVRTDEFILNVTPPADFTIEAYPETLQVLQGELGIYDVLLTSLYGFNSPCTLTVSGLPQDATGEFYPVTLVPTDSSELHVTVAGTTPSGIYPLTITATEMGTGKQIQHSVEVTLVTGCIIIRVPQDYPTIQEAIDVANDCDTVLVAPGLYTGAGNKDISFLGKPIVVKSEKGADSTVIDCQDAGRGFYFHNSETASSRLEGFTITGGNTSVYGGGILCWGSSPTIAYCTIRENTGLGSSEGAGIACTESSSPVIEGCTVTGNAIPGTKGEGGGISCNASSSPTIINCTIVGNTAEEGSGIWCGSNCNPTVLNTIVALNFGIAIFGGHPNADCMLSCSDVHGNTEGNYGGSISDQTGINGNISECPLFCDLSEGEFFISETSPCAPPNNECGVLMGAWDTGCDYLCADATADGDIDVADVVFLLNYLYKGMAAPDPLEAGDVDCDGTIHVADVVYLLNYLYKGGSPPCD